MSVDIFTIRKAEGQELEIDMQMELKMTGENNGRWTWVEVDDE